MHQGGAEEGEGTSNISMPTLSNLSFGPSLAGFAEFAGNLGMSMARDSEVVQAQSLDRQTNDRQAMPPPASRAAIAGFPSMHYPGGMQVGPQPSRNQQPTRQAYPHQPTGQYPQYDPSAGHSSQQLQQLSPLSLQQLPRLYPLSEGQLQEGQFQQTVLEQGSEQHDSGQLQVGALPPDLHQQLGQPPLTNMHQQLNTVHVHGGHQQLHGRHQAELSNPSRYVQGYHGDITVSHQQQGHSSPLEDRDLHELGDTWQGSQKAGQSNQAAPRYPGYAQPHEGYPTASPQLLEHPGSLGSQPTSHSGDMGQQRQRQMWIGVQQAGLSKAQYGQGFPGVVSQLQEHPGSLGSRHTSPSGERDQQPQRQVWIGTQQAGLSNAQYGQGFPGVVSQLQEHPGSLGSRHTSPAGERDQQPQRQA